MSQVSVIGGGSAEQSNLDDARTVGRELARKDVTVICGGKGGVMEAVSSGVNDMETGRVIGILPETNRKFANDYLDDVILTGMGPARNLAVVLSGEAVIAIGGRYGTLSELAFSRKFDRPVFGVSTWDHEEFDFPTNLEPNEAVQRALKVGEC
jgi:uncharacterized protein (TIGR00725 family)